MNEEVLYYREDSTKSYLMYTFANHCMPTLLKIKPASILNFMKKNMVGELDFIKKLSLELRKFDAEYELLHESKTAYCVLIYNKQLLNKIFFQYANHPIMKQKGYFKDNQYFFENIELFRLKFMEYKQSRGNEFPHEAGILLGYPIADVEEYIKNNGENYLLCSYWKVYHNVEDALQTIEIFKELRTKAVKLILSGSELMTSQSYYSLKCHV